MHVLRFIAVSLFALASFASAQEPSERTAAVDRNFIIEAASGSTAEVELGRLVQKNGASPAVKAFAAQMIADHGKAGSELEALAKKLGVAVSPKPGGKHLDAMKRLESLKGAEFDKMYAQQMIADHVATIGLFEKHEKIGSSAELKAFVVRTLPVLREHLKMARALST